MRWLLRIVPVMLVFLAGCGSQLLEEVREITPPQDCAETTKLFNTFAMRAASTAWKGAKGDPAATLTLDLVFTNEKAVPIALSNSGAGVLYTVEITLQGADGRSHKPKEAAGVVLAPPPKPPRERKPAPFFSKYNTGPSATDKRKPESPIRNVNFRMQPGAREDGKLSFEVPRENYLLTIERKFAGRAVSRTPTDHIAVCKISAGTTAALPGRLRAFFASIA